MLSLSMFSTGWNVATSGKPKEGDGGNYPHDFKTASWNRAALVLEDMQERVAWFRERVPHTVYCTTAEDAIRELSRQTFRVVFLDHDLSFMHAADNSIVKGTGKEVAMYLAKAKFRELS